MTQVVVTDYIEPDLEWEVAQLQDTGVQFETHQLKFAPAQELLPAIADADVVIVNMARIDAQVIDGLKKCRLIIRHGVGYDNVDVQAAAERGIQVAYVPDYCVEEVAQQTVMLILACQRKLLQQSSILGTSSQSGEWQFDPIYPVFSLRGKTLGIVGCGRIGSTVLRMMQGFEMSYLVCDPYLSDRRKQTLGIQTVGLAQVLENADVLTVHTPLNEETFHLIDESELEILKPTAVLVNTARGGIVNLRALDRALREGKLAQAGIDVYDEKEPPDPQHPLLHNDRAICTPHLAWLSEESGWSIREKILEDVRRFLRGDPPRFPVDPQGNLVPKSYK